MNWRGSVLRITSLTYIQRKSHVFRNVVLVLILLVLISVLLVALISTYVAWQLSHPERSSIPDFSANIVPKYSDVSFKDKNGEITLKGWYFDVIGSNKSLIIAHGYGSNRLPYDEDTLHLIKSFLDEGYNVLTFDFRNSGESEGDMTTVGLLEKNDLLGAVDFAKKKGSDKIVLLGFSMGASTSILAAAESEDVDAVIADSPFSDLNSYLDDNMYVWSGLPSVPFNKTILLAVSLITGLDLEDASPQQVVHQISPRPLLLIHSKDDQKIPVENSHLIYETSDKANTVFWETSGADHVRSYKVYPDEYVKKVIDFLNAADKTEEPTEETTNG
jgi:dipeptidyl aminopeptidase/acylaminoacyl peptidase